MRSIRRVDDRRGFDDFTTQGSRTASRGSIGRSTLHCRSITLSRSDAANDCIRRRTTSAGFATADIADDIRQTTFSKTSSKESFRAGRISRTAGSGVTWMCWRSIWLNEHSPLSGSV